MIPKKKKMEAIKTNKLKNLKGTKLFKSIKTRMTKKPSRSDRTKTGTGGYKWLIREYQGASFIWMQFY